MLKQIVGGWVAVGSLMPDCVVCSARQFAVVYESLSVPSPELACVAPALPLASVRILGTKSE